MRSIFMTLAATLLLVACGGGDGSATPAAASLNAQRAGNAAPTAGPALIAENASIVNTTTAGQQQLRTIGAVQDGGYTVAWISAEAPFLQRYDDAGIRLGGETPIALTIAADNQPTLSAAIDSTKLAVLGDGSIAIAYRVIRSAAQSNGTVLVSQAAYVQRFDANGNLVTGETQVSPTQPLVGPRSPLIGDVRITALADGGYVVGWTVASFSAQFGSLSVLSLQRYDSQGQPVGGVAGLGLFPALNFSITADAENGYTVVASQLDPSFNPLVSVVHFSSDQTSTQLLAASPGTTALLLPLQDRLLLFVNAPAGGYEQVLDRQGNPIGARTPITATPVVAAELADGSYVLVEPGNGAFIARRFDSRDNPVGRSFTVRTGGAAPQIAALAQDGFALAWAGPGTSGDTDVFTQRFAPALDAQKKACLQRVQGLKGQEHSAAVQACLA
jgi:hypothetical protein